MNPVPVGVGAGGEPRIRVSVPRDHYGSSTPFRRGQAVRRSRRGRLRRRLKPLAVALMLVAGPSTAAAWLMSSPRFAVRELAVVTGERVSETWVREALAPMVGENLPRLPLARAEHILRRHPWVQGADLRKDLPARLAVRVAERRAVALQRAGDGLFYLDSQGARIAPFDPAVGRAVDLPLISVATRLPTSGGADRVPAAQPSNDLPSPETRAPGTASLDLTVPAAGLRSAVRLLSEIDQVEPSWTAGLSEIEVLGEEDFRVYTSALPFPVLVRTGTLNQRVRRLEELLPHIVERFGAADAVDLRFARRIIVQPSVKPGAGPAKRSPETEHQEATSDHAQRG